MGLAHWLVQASYTRPNVVRFHNPIPEKNMKERINSQDVYLKRVQTDYKAYCFHVFNHGKLEEGETLAWVPSKFHVFLCDTVQEFIERKTDKPYEILILSTPPQHGKSKTVTETLPSFYLGKHPTHRVIEISYNETFASTFGKRNKEKINQFGNIFGISLSKDSKSSTEFELSNNIGGMISRGVLSGVTGKSCNLMIIDDPIKNSEDADSESYRNKLFDEWNHSFLTRLAPGAKVIVIQTRWHEDDLAGKLIEVEENCQIINLPMEAEENDPMGREVGDPLCPEMGRDYDFMQNLKENLHKTQSGIRTWNALYQGRPTSLEGNILKREWWNYYQANDYVNKRLQLDLLIMSVDATFKDNDNNDYVAIEVWGKKEANMYLIDLINEHMDFSTTLKAIKGMKAIYPRIGAILVEDKANGSAIIQVLRSQIPGIIGVLPVGGKEARVNSVSFAIEAGNCYLPSDRAFTAMFIDQCASFPNGKHDDMVDSMSQALGRLIFSQTPGSLPEKPKSDWHLNKPHKRGVGKGDTIHVI